jgi:hypothetical protein
MELTQRLSDSITHFVFGSSFNLNFKPSFSILGFTEANITSLSFLFQALDIKIANVSGLASAAFQAILWSNKTKVVSAFFAIFNNSPSPDSSASFNANFVNVETSSLSCSEVLRSDFCNLFNAHQYLYKDFRALSPVLITFNLA